MEVYGKECTSITRVFEWHKRFREGRTDVDDDELSRRPTISKTTNNIREIEKIVREDRWLSIRLIAGRMSIDKETVWQVLHENLHMTKVSAQVISKLLISEQKEKRQEICADILKQIEENPKFFDSVITVPAMKNEYSSTTQRQRGSPCIGKLQTHHELRKQNKAKSKFKAMLIVFFFFMVRVLSCSFFFMEIRIKRCVDAKGDTSKRKQNKMIFFSSLKLLMSPVLSFNSDTSYTVCFFLSQISFYSPLLQT